MTVDFGIFLIVFTIGICGVSFSIYSLYLIIKKPVLHNAFGHICAAHTVSEGAVVGIFSIWVSIILNIDHSLNFGRTNLILGQLINVIYYNAMYLHLLKSINRFCAIIFSYKYRRIFTYKTAKILIFLVLLISILHIIPFFSNECTFYFNLETYIWMVKDAQCADTTAFYVDAGCTLITMTFGLLCDLTTFWFIRFRLKKKRTASLINDIKFVLQTFLTSCFYLLMIIFTYFVSRFATTLWTGFASVTLNWQLCHTLNQFSFIMFITFMNFKRKPRLSKVSVVSVKLETMTIPKIN